MASAASSKDPRELYLLKQKAVKYYEENGVPVKMEEILNSMFHDDPPDVYGHLVCISKSLSNECVLLYHHKYIHNYFIHFYRCSRNILRHLFH